MHHRSTFIYHFNISLLVLNILGTVSEDLKKIAIQELVKTSNCVCKDHRDKIKLPDPIVKDPIGIRL